MAVAVVLSKSAQRDIDALPAVIQARVAAKIAALAAYPDVTGVKSLKGKLKGTYRVRAGEYRILFTLATATITIVAVDDRKDVY